MDLYRAAEKAAAAGEESEPEEMIEDQPAPTSEFEIPDNVDAEGTDAEMEAKHSEPEMEARHSEDEGQTKTKGKAKSSVKGKGKSKKGGKTADDEAEKKPKKKLKAKGGVQIPEHWPWEEAKKLFENPDVLPADQLEVRHLRIP